MSLLFLLLATSLPVRSTVIVRNASSRFRRTVGISTYSWLMTMALLTPANAGVTDAPKRHSLIHRPASPVSPGVPGPQPSAIPAQPTAAIAAQLASSPFSVSLHHKLTKKPHPQATVAPFISEAALSPKAISRPSMPGNLSSIMSPIIQNGPSKVTPTAVSDRSIVPIATTSLSRPSLGTVSTPPSS